MITIKPVTEESMNELNDTSYDEMFRDEKLKMISESIDKAHDGAYFELMLVYDDKTVVGAVSLFAHTPKIISVAPEIKRSFQRRGYAYCGVLLALDHARRLGFTMATAGVREDNTASIALHEKLGFGLCAECVSKRGRPIRIYIKNLLEK